LSTTNDKESFENIPKFFENPIGEKFSELMNSYDSEELKNITLPPNIHNDQLAVKYRKNKLYQKTWKSILFL